MEIDINVTDKGQLEIKALISTSKTEYVTPGAFAELSRFLLDSRVNGCNTIECYFNRTGDCWSKSVYIEDGRCVQFRTDMLVPNDTPDISEEADGWGAA